jgi:AmmeMemoRadiSam system protein A
MPDDRLSPEERKELLNIARQSLEKAVRGEQLPSLQLELMPKAFRQPGVVFVTLTIHGELRGCVGALEAYQTLVEDVREHAIAAALQDYRFPPVNPEELDKIHIEISRLTPPELLEYNDSQELLKRLRPGVDGVILKDGWKRATFLPQVWEKIPDPANFLGNLCLKMGVAPNLWRQKKLEVFIYQVEEFSEIQD